jgi:hypothetical protein
MSTNFSEVASHFIEHETRIRDIPYAPESNPQVMAPLLSRAGLDLNELREEVFIELFRRVQKDDQQALRLYVNGDQSRRGAHELLQQPISDDQTIEAWLTNSIKSGRYGVVINGAEKWSDHLSRWVSRLFKPINAALGGDRSFLEIILFAGNYGFTPFGIHIDDPYSSVVHFHIGPGSKVMTMFSKEEFHALNGPGNRSYSPEKLVPNGHSFPMEPGDIFIQPPHYFHIGNTPDFSVDLTVGVSKMTSPKISRFILSQAIDAEWMDVDLDTLLKRADAYAGGKANLTEWISRGAEEYQSAKASNGNLRYPYMLRIESEVHDNSVLRLDPDFPIKVIKRSDEILVFVRGNRFKLSAKPITDALLTAVLSEEGIFTPTKIQSALNNAISLEAIRTVLSHLVTLGGLSIKG